MNNNSKKTVSPFELLAALVIGLLLLILGLVYMADQGSTVAAVVLAVIGFMVVALIIMFANGYISNQRFIRNAEENAYLSQQQHAQLMQALQQGQAYAQLMDKQNKAVLSHQRLTERVEQSRQDQDVVEGFVVDHNEIEVDVIESES